MPSIVVPTIKSLRFSIWKEYGYVKFVSYPDLATVSPKTSPASAQLTSES